MALGSLRQDSVGKSHGVLELGSLGTVAFRELLKGDYTFLSDSGKRSPKPSFVFLPHISQRDLSEDVNVPSLSTCFVSVLFLPDSKPLQVRRIDAAKDIAENLAKSPNVMRPSSGAWPSAFVCHVDDSLCFRGCCAYQPSCLPACLLYLPLSLSVRLNTCLQCGQTSLPQCDWWTGGRV